MNLDRYVSDLRQQLSATAATGSDATRALAEQLSLSLDAATRLVLLDALSEAAGEITRDIAPGSVELRLRGRDPEFAVSVAPQAAFVDRSAEVPAAVEPDPEPRDDTSTSRTTLRLPDQLKARAEEAAVRDGLSLNTWLVRAIADSLEPRARRGGAREGRTNNSFTGWAR
ncbi:toxin-antitoxin system HicB family antitoxin [Subtercola sp. YIM 133946]|uniref:toxin-antitoxin system HicB family antitoxin n=1 Tax=Subtercola sp. YIM 133946 TaxID=3118909 RepID=UPI002F955D41